MLILKNHIDNIVIHCTIMYHTSRYIHTSYIYVIICNNSAAYQFMRLVKLLRETPGPLELALLAGNNFSLAYRLQAFGNILHVFRGDWGSASIKTCCTFWKEWIMTGCCISSRHIVSFAGRVSLLKRKLHWSPTEREASKGQKMKH